MNRKLTFTGGEPNITTDDIMWQQDANTAAIFGMAKDLGVSASNYIISGVEPGTPNGGNTPFSAGYVFLNGSVVQVAAQSIPTATASEKYKIDLAVTYEDGGNKTFADGTPRQTWQKNRGVISKVSVATAVDLEVSAKTRLKYLVSPILFSRKITKPANNTGENFEYFDIPTDIKNFSDNIILSLIYDFYLVRNENSSSLFSVDHNPAASFEIADDGSGKRIKIRFGANTTVQTDFYLKFSIYPNFKF